ncbi:MAG: SAVED domain-containing protein [Acidimicrobiia bacterium]
MTLAVKAHLPLAVALGHAFARPTGCTIRLHRRDGDDWVACAVHMSENDLIREEALKGPVQARVASLEASISRDVEAGVLAFVRQGNRYRHRLTLKPVGGPSRSAVDGSDTADSWAHQIGATLVTLADRSDIDRADLFLAAPVEVAVLVGSWTNAVGEVLLMDWGKTGPFSRMWSLP